MGSTIIGDSSSFLGNGIDLNGNGSKMIIGMSYNNSLYEGNAKVYEWNGNDWDQIGSDLMGENAGNLNGYSVSISDNSDVIAVGAPGYDLPSTTDNNIGYVRVYEWSGSDWSPKGAPIVGEGADDASGTSCALSADGNTIIIGAPGNIANGHAGSVRVFYWTGADWFQKGLDLDGFSSWDKFGNSVAISDDGNRIAIGASENDSLALDGGQLRMYEWNGNDWVQMGDDIFCDYSPGFFGNSISMSNDGSIITSGSYNDPGGSGSAKIYEWNGISWNQKGTDIIGQGYESLGYATQLSGDGNTIIVGAIFNAELYYEGGAAKIYEWNGTDWNQKGEILYGDYSYDEFGYYVAIDDDGRRIIVSAPNSDMVGYNSGYVKVFEFPSQAGYYEEDQFSYTIYPNPSNGLIKLEITSTEKDYSIVIHNIQGETVYQVNIIDDLVDLDLSILESGIYFLRLVGNNSSEEKRLIIN